jgi:hypothetical protein
MVNTQLLGRQRQEDDNFKTSQGKVARTCLKNKKSAGA